MKKRTLFLITGFILVKFLLQFILISNVYDLQRDEYLHPRPGPSPGMGLFIGTASYFLDIVAYPSFWATCFLGKVFPAYSEHLHLLVVWKTIRDFMEIYMPHSWATCILFSALLRLNTLFQPNSFDVLLDYFLYFVLISYFSSGKQMVVL